MDLEKILNYARKGYNKFMPKTPAGQGKALGVLGALLREANRTTEGGLLLRTSKSNKLRRLAESLASPAADILRMPGTAGAIAKMKPALANETTRTLIKSLLVPQALYKPLDQEGKGKLVDALTMLRQQKPLTIQVDPRKINWRTRHKIIRGYSGTLDEASHGVFEGAKQGAQDEVYGSLFGTSHELMGGDRVAGGSRKPVNDMFKMRVPVTDKATGKTIMKDVYATGRNVNGLAYIEEAAAKNPQERLAWLLEAGKSDTPIGTTVMADIGDRMLGGNRLRGGRPLLQFAEDGSVKLDRPLPNGWHVIASTEGRWGDPLRREIVTPKLILVNDAAMKAGLQETAIAQHTSMYNNNVRRIRGMNTAEWDKIQAMKDYTGATKNFMKNYKKYVQGGQKLQDAENEARAAASAYHNMVDTGRLPSGAAAKGSDMEQALQDMIAKDNAYDEALKPVRAYHTRMRNGGRVATGKNGLTDEAMAQWRQQATQQSPYIPDPGFAHTDRHRNWKIDPKSDNLKLNKQGAAGPSSVSAIRQTFSNALHMLKHDPKRFTGRVVAGAAWRGPLQTLALLSDPKTLFSNKALGQQFRNDYASQKQIYDAIRHIRTNQALSAGAAATGIGLGALALTGKDKPAGNAKTTTPVPQESAPATVEPPVVTAPAAAASEMTAPAVVDQPNGQSGLYAQALDWARNHKTELGAGAALTAAVLGGAYLANRRKRKRRQMAY